MCAWLAGRAEGVREMRNECENSSPWSPSHVVRPTWTGERVIPEEMRKEPRTFQEHLTRYVYALKYAAHKRVLDVGCGTGYGTWLLSCVARRVLGIDNSREAIEYAVETSMPPGGRGSFEIGDIQHNKTMKAADAQSPWDLIVAFEVLEHLDNPRGFVSNLGLWQNPGGELLMSIPADDDGENPFHLWHPKITDVENLLAPYYHLLAFYRQRYLHIDESVSLRPGQERTSDYIICHAIRSGAK